MPDSSYSVLVFNLLNLCLDEVLRIVNQITGRSD